jgi:3-methyladenine DNA glycosylase AlkC
MAKNNYDLAGDSNTSLDVLEKLSKDKDRWVREGVALNTSTPISILEKLSTDEDWYVRRGVAINSSTPIKILEKLSKDKNWKVRKAVQKEFKRRGNTSMYMSMLKDE